jgi:hypothetical protein
VLGLLEVGRGVPTAVLGGVAAAFGVARTVHSLHLLAPRRMPRLFR